MVRIYYQIWINGVQFGFYSSSIICSEDKIKEVLSILEKDKSVVIDKIEKYESEEK